MNEEPNADAPATARVPLFGTWPRAYIAVVAAFVIEVTFFYFFSRFSS